MNEKRVVVPSVETIISLSKSVVTDEVIQKLIAIARNGALSMAADGIPHIPPILLMLSFDSNEKKPTRKDMTPKVVMAPSMYEERSARLAAFRKLGRDFPDKGVFPLAVVLIAEGYAARFPLDNIPTHAQLNEAKYRQQGENETEVLVLLTKALHGAQRLETLEILRDANERMTLKPFLNSDGEEMIQGDDELLESFFSGVREGLEVVVAGAARYAQLISDRHIDKSVMKNGFGWMEGGPAAGKVM